MPVYNKVVWAELCLQMVKSVTDYLFGLEQGIAKGVIWLGLPACGKGLWKTWGLVVGIPVLLGKMVMLAQNICSHRTARNGGFPTERPQGLQLVDPISLSMCGNGTELLDLPAAL